VTFYLKDATGKVLVDAMDAELDLPRCERREIGGLSGLKFNLFRSARHAPAAGAMPSEEELQSYVSAIAAGNPVEFANIFKDDSPVLRRRRSQLPPRSGLDVVKSVFPSRSLSWGGSSSGRYRLSEYCIFPDYWYDVTGTCAENPAPQDEYDRNMILKGENEPTFLISSKSEKELEGGLRRKAALYIFGGAALSLVCLAILLNRFGWL